MCTSHISIASENSIGSINEENIDLKEYERLFNAQKIKFEEGFLFDLSIDHKKYSDIELSRKELLTKAKISGLSVNDEEFNSAWEKVNHQIIAENNLNIDDIKNKLRENLLLEKYFKKEARFKIIDHMIDEILVLQEAKQRNISISEEELTTKLNQVIEKQGGEISFNEFLKQNNATIEDAKNEIKKNTTIELVKKSFPSEDEFINHFRDKKINANIIVNIDSSTENITNCPKEETVISNTLNEQLPEDKAAVIRIIEYPTVTKSKVEEINNLMQESTPEKETHDLRQDTITETNIIRPVYTPTKEKKHNPFTRLFKFKSKKATEPQLLLPKEEINLESAIKLRKEIAVEKIIDSVDTPLPLPQVNQINQNVEKDTNNFSSELSELRKKLEQKLITNKE